jgi:hypothetical protein
MSLFVQVRGKPIAKLYRERGTLSHRQPPVGPNFWPGRGKLRKRQRAR